MRTQWEGGCLQPGGNSPYQKPNLSAPWSWTSRIQNYEKINFCHWSHPGCGLLWWQPERTNEREMWWRSWAHLSVLAFCLGSWSFWPQCFGNSEATGWPPQLSDSAKAQVRVRPLVALETLSPVPLLTWQRPEGKKCFKVVGRSLLRHY